MYFVVVPISTYKAAGKLYVKCCDADANVHYYWPIFKNLFAYTFFRLFYVYGNKFWNINATASI